MVVFPTILLLMKFINDILNGFCLLTGVLKGWLPTVCDFSGLTSFSSWIETPSFIIRVISRGFPDSSAGKESVWHAGDPGSTPGSGRSPGDGNGNPLQPSILAWRIPWSEKPGQLQSMRSQRVSHDWGTNIFTFIQIVRMWKLARRREKGILSPLFL